MRIPSNVALFAALGVFACEQSNKQSPLEMSDALDQVYVDGDGDGFRATKTATTPTHR